MDLRYELLSRLRAGERVTDLAQEYGVSRKTVYKFKTRLEHEGLGGLCDAVRRPKRLANKTTHEVEQAILALKGKHKTWGAKKIRHRLPQVYPGIHVPARSTVHLILVRNGCVQHRTRPARVSAIGTSLRTVERPNHVWGVDFKGQFRLGDKSYCYPLTASDLFARFVLGIEALGSTEEDPVIEAFIELFRQYGLPEALRTDHGVPFASTALWGLSRLSVLWLRLGIEIERIAPGCPEQNGCHERMHRTLKFDATRPSGKHLLEQQQKFDTFRHVFNHERPHEALDMRVPADLYRSSSRPCPTQLPEPDYPFADDVVRVGADGHLRLHGQHRFYLTRPLAGQSLGVQEQLDGTWLLSFAAYDLGLYHPSQRLFRPFDFLRESSLGVHFNSKV